MVEWSYDRMGSGVVGSGVVRSYGPIDRKDKSHATESFEAKGYLREPTRYSIFQ